MKPPMGLYKAYIGYILGLYRGYFGIMDKKMETTIMSSALGWLVKVSVRRPAKRELRGRLRVA